MLATRETQEMTVVSAVQVAHQPLSEFITQALAACGSESPHTRRAYTRAWGDFLVYLSSVWGLPRPLAEKGAELRGDGRADKTTWAYAGDTRIFCKISPSLRDGYNQVLVEAGRARATRNQAKNAVNTLLSIAYRDGYIEDGAANRLGLRVYAARERKSVQPVGRRLSPPEVRALRETVILQASSERKAARDRAILDCMLFAGLRREEVASLTTGSLKSDGGRWWLVLTGKGQKTRRVKVHDTLYKSLASWAASSNLVLGEGADPLFCNLTKGGNPTGKILNSSVIGRLVAEYGHLAGLAPLNGENRLSPHDLRRTCARNAFDNGASLPQVQIMLGHADVKTTMTYIGSVEDDDDTATDYVNYVR